MISQNGESQSAKAGETSAPDMPESDQQQVAELAHDLLMVGQTPPPYYGQAVATGILFEHEWTRIRVSCLRMNYSKSGDEVGKAGVGKLVSLVKLVVRTWKELRNQRAPVLYYLPASPHFVPVLRDIVYLALVRPFAVGTIYHFHAGGLADYLASHRVLGVLARLAYGRPRLAIEIAESATGVGEYLGAASGVIIRNGLEVPAPVARASRNNGVLTGLFVGSLRESKGIFDILRLVRALADRDVPVRIELAGVWVSEDERIRFDQEFSKLDLGDRVVLLGELVGESKWQAFQRADFFCFPSFYESENFPLVLIEALGSGLPVVATRWRGIPEVVDEGSNAILCETHDIDGFADAIERLHVTPEMRQSMSGAARSAYLSQYTREIYCENMECALVKALESEGGPS